MSKGKGNACIGRAITFTQSKVTKNYAVFASQGSQIPLMGNLYVTLKDFGGKADNVPEELTVTVNLA